MEEPEHWIITPDEERHEMRLPVRVLCSSFRAEMTALRVAFDYVLEKTGDIQDPVIVCIDSRSALAALREGPATQRFLQGSEVWHCMLAVSAEERPVILQ